VISKTLTVGSVSDAKPKTFFFAETIQKNNNATNWMQIRHYRCSQK